MQVSRGLQALAASGLVALCGCSVARTHYIQLNPGTSYRPRAENSPVVLTVGDLDEPYEELGMIYVSGLARAGYADLNERIRMKAREQGADGVIFMRYGAEHALSFFVIVVSIPWDVVTAEGLAVRSKPR